MSLYIVYCDTTPSSPIVLAAGSEPCDAETNATYASIATLEKSSEDYEALFEAHRDGLFTYIKDTWGSEMT